MHIESIQYSDRKVAESLEQGADDHFFWLWLENCGPISTASTMA